MLPQNWQIDQWVTTVTDHYKRMQILEITLKNTLLENLVSFSRYRNLQNIQIRTLQIFVLIFLMNLQQTVWGKY